MTGFLSPSSVFCLNYLIQTGRHRQRVLNEYVCYFLELRLPTAESGVPSPGQPVARSAAGLYRVSVGRCRRRRLQSESGPSNGRQSKGDGTFPRPSRAKTLLFKRAFSL